MQLELEQLPQRPTFGAMMRGAASRCPSCGEGRLFAGWLKVSDQCDACSEDLSHQRADDLPAYLNIFVTGHIVVAGLMLALKFELADPYVVMFASFAAAIALSVLMMRPLKGMVVGAQWALRMHGFGGHDD